MYTISRPCPKCNEHNTLTVSKSTISCTHETCSYSIGFRCPLCDSSLKNSEIAEDHQGHFIKCTGCKKDIHLKRIQNIINNVMQISHDHACKLCNGPTVYRTQANMGHRCFYFPKCSGQSSLFSQKKESLVFLDFETTGLEPGKDYIIEIGALKIDEEGFEHTFDTFIKPPISIPERIQQITKINNDMLIDAPEMDTVIQDFYNFVGDATIVAHNAEFDITWLLMEYFKYNLSHQDNSIICTLKWAQKMKEGRCSLSALTKKYKIGHLNAHRAIADSAVTKELFFIYEDAQKIPRPIQPIESFMKIVDKLKKVPVKKQ